MILYSEKDFKGNLKRQIDNLLGERISIREQISEGSTGSALYRLSIFNINNKINDLTDSKPRCNFEKYKKGLLLRVEDFQDHYCVALSYNSIDNIELIKGKESILPFIISPFRLLLEVGVHVRYARYFRLYLSEYSIEPMTLTIKVGNDFIRLESHGYNYYSEIDYFEPIMKLIKTTSAKQAL